MKFSSKIRGIFKVSSANIIGLVLTMLTSFVLPIFISVEQYGYWQLFIMYFGYLGFFVLGFNDGVHLNYAVYDYDEQLAAKFRTFKSFLTILTGIESIVLGAVLFCFTTDFDNIFYIFLLCIFNILPLAINGLFSYMNQATMRFNEYAVGNIIGNIIFTIIMVVMLLCRIKQSLYYIIAYTITRYLVIGYHWYSSRMVFTITRCSFLSLKGEIINNFKYGFPLMIASVLQGTIILVSRLLIQGKFGIEAFSAYSFSLHTIVIAAQFIGAIATVFYPIMKRVDGSMLHQLYNSFDKIATIASAVLLVSYFAVVVIVKVVYVKYIEILDYLFWVYPLFIYNCKSNLLIINFFKVKNEPIKMIIVNALGTLINIIFVYSAYYIWGSIYSIACGVLLGYSLWYYLCQVYIYYSEKWRLRITAFYDFLLVAIFSFLIIFIKDYLNDSYLTDGIALLLFVSLCIVIYFIYHRRINASIKEFTKLMRD